ncbi:Integrator complex subunit 9, variant 2 [Basidiobolus ranarum]
MLALPFITEYTDFKGQIYATEPTINFGCQLMEELVKYAEDPFYQREHSNENSNTSKYTSEFNQKSSLLRRMYSFNDIQSCIYKIQPIRYQEKLSLVDSIEVTATSSGYCLGGSNWLIKYGDKLISFISTSSVAPSTHASPFDPSIFKNSDMTIFGEVSLNSNIQPLQSFYNELCTSTAKTLRKGGNVIFPTYPCGTLFDIIEVLSKYLSNMSFADVHMYVISPVAAKSLQYSNILAEWMCSAKQEKVYLPEAPLIHSELIANEKLSYYPNLSEAFGRNFKEPCIIFAGHPSLMVGDVTRFIDMWKNDPKNTIIFTDAEYDYIKALKSCQPLSLNVNYCPLEGGLNNEDVELLVRNYKLSHVVVPKDQSFHKMIDHSTTVNMYTPLEIVSIPLRFEFDRVLLTEPIMTALKPTSNGHSEYSEITGSFGIANGKNEIQLGSVYDIPNLHFQRQRHLYGDVDLTKVLNRLDENEIEYDYEELDNDTKIVINLQCKHGKGKITIDSRESSITAENNTLRSILKDIFLELLTAA